MIIEIIIIVIVIIVIIITIMIITNVITIIIAIITTIATITTRSKKVIFIVVFNLKFKHIRTRFNYYGFTTYKDFLKVGLCG